MLLKYGIVSCATICDRFIHAVQVYGDEVVAIASRSYEKAQKKAQEYGIKAYGSYEEMYQDTSIDIVYIATNNATHVQEIKRALSYKKHVICEKPIALCKQDAIDVFQYAKQQGCFLMEAQKSVFLPVIQDIKDIIQHKTYGALHQIEMSSSFPNPASPWMHDPTQGGVVYGSASYTLELLDYLLEPRQMSVQACGIREKSGTCERVSINLMTEDVLINSRISMNGDTKQHALFYFEQGYVEVPTYWKAREYHIYIQDTCDTRRYPIEYEMIYEIQHIHECIKQGLLQSSVMSAKRSILCCEFVDDIIKQINERKSCNTLEKV